MLGSAVREQLLKVLGATDTTGRCGRSPGAQTEECLEAGHRGPPPIVPKYELIEVGRELGAAHPVVRADQPLLEVPIARSASGTTDFAPRRRSVRDGCVR